ncbi:unnamed protein product [Boreogadus saida]
MPSELSGMRENDIFVVICSTTEGVCVCVCVCVCEREFYKMWRQETEASITACRNNYKVNLSPQRRTKLKPRYSLPGITELQTYRLYYRTIPAEGARQRDYVRQTAPLLFGSQ